MNFGKISNITYEFGIKELNIRWFKIFAEAVGTNYFVESPET